MQRYGTLCILSLLLTFLSGLGSQVKANQWPINWPPIIDPGTSCYQWPGTLCFCNWHSWSQQFSRGPYIWSNDDYIYDLRVTLGETTFHVTVTIESCYYPVGSPAVWYVYSECASGTPATFNNNGNWARDCNTYQYFQNCDTCPGGNPFINILKCMFYCFPGTGAVTVAPTPGTGTPIYVATTIMNWLNEPDHMLRPSSNPPANPSPGPWAVYARRYDPSTCQ
jgi:hypothetical protein